MFSFLRTQYKSIVCHESFSFEKKKFLYTDIDLIRRSPILSRRSFRLWNILKMQRILRTLR